MHGFADLVGGLLGPWHGKGIVLLLTWAAAAFTLCPQRAQAALDPAPDNVLPGGEGVVDKQPAPGAAAPGPAGSTPPFTPTTTTTAVPAPAPVVSDATCEGYCAVGQSPSGCFCDAGCLANGDCCVDQVLYCGVTTTTTQSLPLGTCTGSGDNYPVDWTYSEIQDMVTALRGDTVTFTYMGTHTVYALASEQLYDACDFTGALYVGGNVGNSPFELCTTDMTPGTYYLACRIGSHCLYGNMRVTLRVAEIGPSLQAGLVEYFPEGALTCSLGANRIKSYTGTTLGECYAYCFDHPKCNFVLWQDTVSNKCTLYKDCSNRCELSSGTDCTATNSLRRTLVGEVGTTYAVAAGYATCTFAVNDWENEVWVNELNATEYVVGNRHDDRVDKAIKFSHFQDTSYTLAFSGQDSTPESCFERSSLMLSCASTEAVAAWNGVVSESGQMRGYSLDDLVDFVEPTEWFARVDTVAGSALFTYDDSHWANVCDPLDNMWDCAGCETSGSGKTASHVWGCPDPAHPCNTYAWFRLDVFSSAITMHTRFGLDTCPEVDLVSTHRAVVLNECYRLCAREVLCAYFFFSTDEVDSVTGFVCRLYKGTCKTVVQEEADEAGIVYAIRETCHDGRTNQDELYHDCGGRVCDQCVCEDLEYGNPLVDGGCLQCTVLDACPSGMYYDASFCPGNETLNPALTYVFPTDDTCRNCTLVGECAQFFFWSEATDCFNGDGSVDDICQPCTPAGECDKYYYYVATNCQGDTTEDDTCVPCSPAGACVAGEFFDIGECQGETSADTTCQPCEYDLLGICTRG